MAAAAPRDLRGAAWALAAALAAHIPSLRAGWVLDDWELLVENPYVRSAGGLRVLLTRELFAATGEARLVPYYRPVTGFVYWLTYSLFGASPLLHHAFNVALHGACVVLFFFLVRALSVSARAATAMSVLFAVHPVSAEVVAYTGGRQDVLGWSLTFATMLLLLRASTVRRLAVVAFAGTLLAALTREFFLAAPLLHVVVALAAPHGRRKHSALAIGGGGILAAAAVLGLRRVLMIAPFDVGPKRVTEIVGTMAAVLGRFVADVFAPADLVVDVSVHPLDGGLAAVVLIGAIAVFVVGLRLVRRRAPDAAGAFVLGGATLAALTVLHTPVALRMGVISDRYAYGAVAAILLAAAPALDAIAARLGGERPLLRVATLAGTAVAIIPFTWARAADYASDDTLALAMIRERPDDPQAILAQIAALRGAGKKEEAYPLCHRYAEVMPKSLAVHPCLTEEAIAKKDYVRAANLLEPWVYSRPGDAAARGLYFDTLFRIGDVPRLKAALDYFEPVEPNAPDVRAAREAFDRTRPK